jgi:riboflavin kinase/FMN adenylyltransferase
MHRVSQENGKPSVVVTFHPHPRIVLKKEAEHLHLLATLEEKKKLLAETGIDYLVILNFNHELAALTPEQFVCGILIKKLGAKIVFVGYDHQFGKNKSGNKNTLKEVSCRHSLEVREVKALTLDNQIISSSVIRQLLEASRVAHARRMLGYPYSITGHVVKGNMLGRKIGYPTANIVVKDQLKLIPGRGVYAVKVFIQNNWHSGMLNIGKRPTLNTTKATVEVHIFDLNANLYDEEITIQFLEFIREERKFPGLADLKKQLDKDKEMARNILNAEKAKDFQ